MLTFLSRDACPMLALTQLINKHNGLLSLTQRINCLYQQIQEEENCSCQLCGPPPAVSKVPQIGALPGLWVDISKPLLEKMRTEQCSFKAGSITAPGKQKVPIMPFPATFCIFVEESPSLGASELSIHHSLGDFTLLSHTFTQGRWTWWWPRLAQEGPSLASPGS